MAVEEIRVHMSVVMFLFFISITTIALHLFHLSLTLVQVEMRLTDEPERTHSQAGLCRVVWFAFWSLSSLLLTTATRKRKTWIWSLPHSKSQRRKKLSDKDGLISATICLINNQAYRRMRPYHLRVRVAFPEGLFTRRSRGCWRRSCLPAQVFFRGSSFASTRIPLLIWQSALIGWLIHFQYDKIRMQGLKVWQKAQSSSGKIDKTMEINIEQVWEVFCVVFPSRLCFVVTSFSQERTRPGARRSAEAALDYGQVLSGLHDECRWFGQGQG